MKNRVYNKLVRDRIPEIIEADGKSCINETLSDAQYLEMLDAKLNEELASTRRANPWRSWLICWRSCGQRSRPRAGAGSSWSKCGKKNLPNRADLKRKYC